MTAPAAHAASGKIPLTLTSHSGNGVSLHKGLQRRIAKAQAYAASRPGVAGIVVRDRETGAVWRNANSPTHIWGCSTPKLAMVVDLLLTAPCRRIPRCRRRPGRAGCRKLASVVAA